MTLMFIFYLFLYSHNIAILFINISKALLDRDDVKEKIIDATTDLSL